MSCRFAIEVIDFVNFLAEIPSQLVLERHHGFGFCRGMAFHNSLVTRSANINTTGDFWTLRHDVDLHSEVVADNASHDEFEIGFPKACCFAVDRDEFVAAHYFNGGATV